MKNEDKAKNEKQKTKEKQQQQQRKNTQTSHSRPANNETMGFVVFTPIWNLEVIFKKLIMESQGRGGCQPQPAGHGVGHGVRHGVGHGRTQPRAFIGLSVSAFVSTSAGLSINSTNARQRHVLHGNVSLQPQVSCQNMSQLPTTSFLLHRATCR